MSSFRSNLRVVLCQPRNPLNMGAAARAASNFGCREFRLVNPFDLAFREAVSAVGGAAVLQCARVFETVAEAVADCSLVVGTTAGERRDLEHPLIQLEAAGSVIRGAAHQSAVAILFGSEKFGLSNEEIDHCHWLMRIVTSEETPSMNLGQAVAVCLYEITRAENCVPNWPPRREMRAEDAEQLSRMLLQVLRESGYTNRIVTDSIERKVRRFLRRVNFSHRDAPLLLGMLRQILWKFRQ